ncbi:hypothetical protein [Roseateles paludis]|jgi:hypothetical protein|uniref:Uncharacterized protein n=1 Tax=Roseateles paludis TaxID=3145238 RepID=A0ABV0FVS5_9BURK
MADDPAEFAYCEPVAREIGHLKHDGDALALADRYGGRGVGRNGGSGRCGVVGDIQIKGLGRTPLAAMSAPFWHSFGGSSLQDCLREVYFTRFAEAALPHGVTKVFAAIATETFIPAYPGSAGSAEIVPRCILLREFDIRFAHLMPARHFLSPDLAEGDALRTISMREWAREHLQLSRNEWPLITTASTRALDALLKKQAEQIARAISKRFVHGGVGPSNVCLSGRWLDFSASHILPHYGIVTGRRGPHYLVEQATHLARMLSRCIARSFPTSIAPHFGANYYYLSFMQWFWVAFGEALLRLSGLPIVDRCAIRDELEALLVQMFPGTDLVRNAGLADEYPESEVPLQEAGCRIDLILLLASLTRDAEKMDRWLRSFLPNELTRSSFVRAYCAYFNLCVARTSHGTEDDLGQALPLKCMHNVGFDIEWAARLLFPNDHKANSEVSGYMESFGTAMTVLAKRDSACKESRDFYLNSGAVHVRFDSGKLVVNNVPISFESFGGEVSSLVQ